MRNQVAARTQNQKMIRIAIRDAEGDHDLHQHQHDKLRNVTVNKHQILRHVQHVRCIPTKVASAAAAAAAVAAAAAGAVAGAVAVAVALRGREKWLTSCNLAPFARAPRSSRAIA